MRARVLFLFLVLATGLEAQSLVVDEVGTLTSDQLKALTTATADGRVGVHLSATTGTQTLRAYSDLWAGEMKSSKDPNLEVAITVVPSHRQIYLSVAKEARSQFTSADASQIVHQVLIPSFQAGDLAGGLGRAVQSIDARLSLVAGAPSTNLAGTQTQASETASVAPAPSGTGDGSGFLFVLFGLLAIAVVAAIAFGTWWPKFRRFEAVVSSGVPDFVMDPEVEALPKVQEAFENLQDLHRAHPTGFLRQVSFYRRRTDDFLAAYEVCRRAQAARDLERQREEDRLELEREAQRKFESIQAKADALPEAERERFTAMQLQYQNSGYNNALLLQNMVMMDLWMHAVEPPVIYENETTIVNNDPQQGSWGGGWDGDSDDFGGGGDSGGDFGGGGDGGSW